MKRIASSLVLIVVLLASCGPSTPTADLAPLRVQYTAAAQPWLADLYGCATHQGVTIHAEQRAGDYFGSGVDVAIRIGRPADLTSPAYQIGIEEILVIVNRQNPVNKLDAGQVRGLFTGQIQTWKDINGTDALVQVWVFAPGEDVQQVFQQAALGGSPVMSTARLATGPEEMSQAIGTDVNAIGILLRHWKMENVSGVFTVAAVPVLAITSSEPQGTAANLLTCLQK